VPETVVRLASGKVRDLYRLEHDRILLTASDRISTFDVVLRTLVPDKGRVLTGLSAFWFARSAGIVPNHMLAIREDGRSLECRRLEMLPIEVVVRGYLAGSGWRDYLATGSISGHQLPAGLLESEPLPEAIVTPATKAHEGHDLNISEAEAAELCGGDRFERAREAALALYRFAARHAEACGIIVADTKFEFGVDAHGTVTLADEALTPDSSRFWPVEGYRPGGPQPSFDKQFVRDWCESIGWGKTAPGPTLPEHVVEGTRARYIEAFERLTGVSFDRYLVDPPVVLR
jgi:phosphoribosylaminoimidazole-succinocarboxamide synthase